MTQQQTAPDAVRRDEMDVREAYEKVPYASAAHYHTHPDLLAILAILHGLEPAPPSRCSVLELGCAGGDNILPMAYDYPESRFLGIDLSAGHVRRGREVVESLGLSNIELREMSVLDVDASFGKFDYVIAHGLFSWVSEPVQEKVLEICKENLADNGIAYVSYNARPGWNLLNTVRDMMLYHTRGVDDPLDRAEKSFELVSFMAESLKGIGSPHALMFDWARDRLAALQDDPSFLVHDFLEKHNLPCYFHEFMTLAEGHGLRYLAEADRAHMGDNLPPWIAEQLHRLTNERNQIEQYMDFLTNRPFRRTLLCHQDFAPERDVSADRLRRFFAACPAQPASEDFDLFSTESERFVRRDGRVFSSSHPVAKAVLLSLCEIWPRVLPFDELREEVVNRLRLGPEDAPGPEDFATVVGTFFFSGVVELFLTDPGCTQAPGEAPTASPFARHQATKGKLVVNRRHQAVQLHDEASRIVLAHLDGRHDRQALLSVLEEAVMENRLQIQEEGRPVDPARLPELLPKLLDETLKVMTYHALLVKEAPSGDGGLPATSGE